MKVKSARAFRSRYKTDHKKIPAHDNNYNEHFMGTYYDMAEGQRVKGFFEMYHGDKPDIGSYLPSILKIAEDGQAIYEFLQNAVDCGSTECFIFYDDLHFLAINNGKSFSQEELGSLLNIAQSPKKDANQIGRFGVGFKLIHRLVGKSDGVEELINDYRGPVLFSWKWVKDLVSFLNKEPISCDNNFLTNADLPVLLKILLTNFPAETEEVVKDLEYKDRVVFSANELTEMQDFISSSLIGANKDKDLSFLDSGSMFFIKLGEGKRNLLDREYDDLVKGIQLSMNTLKQLEKVYINNEEIYRFPLIAEDFEISKDSEAFQRISPEYKEFPIRIMFGHSDLLESEKIKLSPNFYKYFPMGDEVNGFSFMLHSDGFSNEVNRRKLQQDTINKNLLTEIAELITERMTSYKSGKVDRFLQIYGNILLSDIPNKQNNDWLGPVFYDRLIDYLRTNIPTDIRGFCSDHQFVKIKDMRIDVRLEDVGLGDYSWFVWNPVNNKNISREAEFPEKLDIERWDIRDILERAELAALNKWIENRSDEQYDILLKEIERGEKELRKDTVLRLKEIKLFKFSDGRFYSFQDAVQNPVLIFNFERTVGIKEVLERLGFVTSCLDISANKRIYEKVFVELYQSENKLYESIASKCMDNTLSADEKRRLFDSLVSEDIGFNINEQTIGNLTLFSDRHEKIKPVGQLICPQIHTPEWLDPYKINAAEYFDSLDNLLLKENRIYSKVIVPNFDEIKSNVVSVVDFYDKVVSYYTLDDSHETFSKQEVIFVNEQTGYVGSDVIFYNEVLAGISLYEEFASAILSLIGIYIPDRNIISHLAQEPFELTGSYLLGYSLNTDARLTKDEMRAVLSFCQQTRENFFDEYIIVKENKFYRLLEKGERMFQVRISNRYKRIFTERFSDIFYILPQEFDEYSELNGIVQREELSLLTVEMGDVDNYREELAGIISTDESKKKYIEKLSDLTILTTKNYVYEDYEYKVLDWASRLLDEQELKEFREKVYIQTSEEKLQLNSIPPFADKIYMEGVELSLSKIFPQTCSSVHHLNIIEEKFESIGPRLDKVLGIEEQEDYQHYFDRLRKFELRKLNDGGYGIENTEQLVFITLYLCSVDKAVEDLYVYTEHDDLWLLSDTYYTRHYSFIHPQYIIDSKTYSDLDIYRDVLSKIACDKFSFPDKPILSGNILDCTGFKDELQDEEKKDFLTFLHGEWKNAQTKLPSIHWAEMSETENIFGCNPGHLVYPDEYAEESEVLPAYMKEWLKSEGVDQKFLEILSINGVDSNLVKLRSHFVAKSDFDISLCREIPDELLMNTLKWLSQNRVKVLSPDCQILFTEIVGILDGKITRICVFDEEDIFENSIELASELYDDWKDKNNYSIYLHNGPISMEVTFEETGDYVFYQAISNLAVLDDHIYVNKELNPAKALELIVNSSDLQVDTNALLSIFSSREEFGLKLTKEEEKMIRILHTLPPEERDRRVSDFNSHLLSSANSSGEYDSLRRTALNSGEAGERIVKADLERHFGEGRVKWTSSMNPHIGINSTDEYDFEVYDESRTRVIYYVDAKSTTKKKYQGSETDIIWKNSEWLFLEKNKPDNYLIGRVFGCTTGKPDITYLHVKAIELHEEEK